MTAAEWGIPTLDLAMQATEVVAPVWPYGTVGRTRRVGGTVHFYLDDQHFTHLYAKPERLLLTGCEVACEPNGTTGPRIPRAVALYGVYRKRACAAFWQRHGVRTIVDLNVSDEVLDLALIGVPRGWRAYSDRSHRGDKAVDHDKRFRLAQDHAGTPDVLFILVGGGKGKKALCAARGWVHVPEHSRVKCRAEAAYGEQG